MCTTLKPLLDLTSGWWPEHSLDRLGPQLGLGDSLGRWDRMYANKPRHCMVLGFGVRSYSRGVRLYTTTLSPHGLGGWCLFLPFPVWVLVALIHRDDCLNGSSEAKPASRWLGRVLVEPDPTSGEVWLEQILNPAGRSDLWQACTPLPTQRRG